MEHEGKINFGNCVDNLAANETLRPLPTSLQSNERLFAVLYTSGSTGRPKGARILHRSVLNRLFWQWKTFPYSPKDTCMFKVYKTNSSQTFFLLRKKIKVLLFFKNLYNCICLSESDYLDRYCIEYQYVEFVFVFYL